MPSLGTATKLARGLRELRDDADTPAYLGLVSSGTTNPTARVEYALRGDDLLAEPQVRQIMEYYLAVRMRRYGRAYQPDGDPTTSTTTATTSSPDSSGSTRLASHALRPTSTVTSRPFGTMTSATGGSSSTGSISTIATVRPVSRSSGREPGRY
jgi:hypothetical protein